MNGPGNAEREARARRIEERVDQTQTFLDAAQRNLGDQLGRADVSAANVVVAAAQAQATLAVVVALTRIAESLESVEAA